MSTPFSPARRSASPGRVILAWLGLPVLFGALLIGAHARDLLIGGAMRDGLGALTIWLVLQFVVATIGFAMLLSQRSASGLLGILAVAWGVFGMTNPLAAVRWLNQPKAPGRLLAQLEQVFETLTLVGVIAVVGMVVLASGVRATRSAALGWLGVLVLPAGVLGWWWFAGVHWTDVARGLFSQPTHTLAVLAASVVVGVGALWCARQPWALALVGVGLVVVELVLLRDPYLLGGPRMSSLSGIGALAILGASLVGAGVNRFVQQRQARQAGPPAPRPWPGVQIVGADDRSQSQGR